MQSFVFRLCLRFLRISSEQWELKWATSISNIAKFIT